MSVLEFYAPLTVTVYYVNVFHVARNLYKFRWFHFALGLISTQHNTHIAEIAKLILPHIHEK